MALAVAAKALAADGDPRLPVVSTQTLPHPYHDQVRVDNGMLIYAHYSADGNNRDVLMIDPESGAVRKLLERAPAAGFIAANDQYVVYLARGNVANRLVAIDQTTGGITRSVRLKDPIVWGRIVEDRLIVFQFSEVLVFSLPDMKLVRRVPPPDSTLPRNPALIQNWGDRIVAVMRRELVTFDLGLNVLSRTPIAPGLDRRCDINNLRIAGSLAVLAPDCGSVRGYDLRSNEVAWEVIVGGIYPKFDLMDGVLFVADSKDDGQNRLRAYDTGSGRILAFFPVVAHTLVVRGRHLLTMTTGQKYPDPDQVTIYAPDTPAIRDETERRRRLIAACSNEATGPLGDMHRAIDICEKAGIQYFVGIRDLPPDVKPVLGRYARWLALSHSRYREAFRMLDHLKNAAERESLRSLIERKKRLLDERSDAPSTEPLPPGIRKVALRSGVGGALQIGERLFVSRYGCSDGGAQATIGVDVLERSDLRRVAEFEIAPCAADEIGNQDYSVITGMIQFPGSLVVTFDDRGEARVGEIDLVALRFTPVEQIEGGVQSVTKWNDRLLRCDEPVRRLELATTTFVDATDDERSACKAQRELVIDDVELGQDPLRSRDFILARQYGLNTLVYRVLRADRSAAPYELERRREERVIVPPDRNVAIFIDSYAQHDEFRRVSVVDLETRTETTLFEVNDSPSWGVHTVWRQYLLMSRGRDLLTYDFVNRTLLGYEKDLIREGREPLGSGSVDRNEINSFVFLDDRLVVQTRNPVNSLMIDLPKYIGSLDKRGVFQEPR